ncbi:DUF2268 domain-containing protein [Halalkalibacter urbisdiaboli]|uniref:DUF2268 domain-containing protein n=1 Tax=Halalkalibacter urbisdiaboli TaxID=1960589 RepID=UPI0013FD12E4|nr:DUF2268 domain-containing protein [Halalkalibacter urbisdiaboli]
MGVVRTDKWLTLYLKQWLAKRNGIEKYKLQQQTIIYPLAERFQTEDIQGFHHYLNHLGLFSADTNIESTLETFFNKNWWYIVQDQFERLKKKWGGPDIPIYLFPVEAKHPIITVDLGKKMGLTLPKLIILFIDGLIKEDDVRALVTHEYHHACRLSNTEETEETIPLVESMLMEGLAELAVNEEVGKHALAGWTSYYDDTWQDTWFERWLKPHLFLKGRDNHYLYLYGASTLGIPKWLGYYWGYLVVQTINTKYPATTKEWLGRSSSEILKMYATTMEGSKWN